MTIIVRESRVFVCVFTHSWIFKKPLGKKFAFLRTPPSLKFTPQGRTASASAPQRKAKSFSRLSGGHEDEPAQRRRQSRQGTWTRFREGKATNHRAGPCFVRGGSQPARLGPGRCEVRATPWNSPNVHAPWTHQYGTDVSSFCIHRGFTLARCTHRAHIPAPAFAPFSPSRGETRLLTFPFLPIHGQVQRQAQPLHRAAPVSYRGPGVGRGRLPRRRDPLARRRLVPRAAGARARGRARRPGQPHAQRTRGRRGVHGRVSRARRAKGTRHRPEDEAPGAQRGCEVLVRAHRQGERAGLRGVHGAVIPARAGARDRRCVQKPHGHFTIESIPFFHHPLSSPFTRLPPSTHSPLQFVPSITLQSYRYAAGDVHALGRQGGYLVAAAMGTAEKRRCVFKL